MPAVKKVGEPCAGEPHARVDRGREQTSVSRPRRTTPGASRLPDNPPAQSRVGGSESLPTSGEAAATLRNGYDQDGVASIAQSKAVVALAAPLAALAASSCLVAPVGG
jgi:hypothetical protein